MAGLFTGSGSETGVMKVGMDQEGVLEWRSMTLKEREWIVVMLVLFHFINSKVGSTQTQCILYVQGSGCFSCRHQYKQGLIQPTPDTDLESAFVPGLEKLLNITLKWTAILVTRE